MTSEQRAVLDVEPSATCEFDADRGVFKVWYEVVNLGVDPDGGAFERVPLSSSWETEREAWKDAAEAVERRLLAKG